MTREPPAGDGSPIVRCLTAAHHDLAAIDHLPATDTDGIHQRMTSAAAWWWQASRLAADPDQARTLAARARVLGLRATKEWDADDEAWLLDELERLLDFEEEVGAGALVDVVGALSGLHTARREATDDVDTDAAAGAVGA